MTVVAPIAYEILESQSAAETVAGTKNGSPVWFKLHDLGFVFQSKTNNVANKKAGNRAPVSGNRPGRRMVDGTMKGIGNYNELPLIMSMFVAPVVTAIGTSVAWKYVFKISTHARDVFKSRSFQYGDGETSRGYEILYTLLSSFNIKTTPSTFDVDGKTLSRARSNAITMAGGATVVPRRVIDPLNTEYFYANTSFADLDTADALETCYGGDVNTDGLWVPNNPADKSQKSYKFVEPGALKAGGQIIVAANDTDSNAFEDDYHNNKLGYFRIQNIDGESLGVDALAAEVYSTMQVDACISFNGEAQQSNIEEGLADTHAFDLAEDPTTLDMVVYTIISNQHFTYA